MSMVKKNITVTNQQDRWIKSRIDAGHYRSESELLRDLIRREQIRIDALDALRSALIEGEESGISDRTPEEILNAAKAQLRTEDKL